MNIGAAVAPDAALASIISTVLVIAGHQSIGAGIALAIPLAAAGQVLTIIVRTITVAFQHAADKAAENGNLTALSWLTFLPCSCRQCVSLSRQLSLRFPSVPVKFRAC
jgi:PTS system mannose-specific IIC component